MSINIGHVVAISLALGIGAFVFVVGFAPMDEAVNPRAGALDRVPVRGTLINAIRRSLGSGQLAETDRLADLLLEHNPEDPEAFFWRATTDELLGDMESALGYWTRLDGLLGGLQAWPKRYSEDKLEYFRAWSTRGIGKIDRSRSMFGKIADDLEARSDLKSGRSDDLRVIHYNLACYRSMSGEFESALFHWKLAVELGYGRDSGWWTVDPDLEPLHGDDRFWAIGEGVKQVGSGSDDDG